MAEIQPNEVKIPTPWGHIAGCWWGDSHRRPLLAIHGWQDNAGSFARLAPLIAAHMPVLAIDLQGHGQSSHFPPGIDYHSNDYLRLMHSIVHHYQWPKVSLMGHSMGSALCFHFASIFPHLVDLIIAIDSLVTLYFPPHIQIVLAQHRIENLQIEDERLRQCAVVPQEPPLYTYDELQQSLFVAAEQSVDVENCKYLLERCIKPSALEPNKFYFSRDRRVKLLDNTFTEPQLRLTLANRIRNVHYLVLKAEKSDHLNDEAKAVIAVLRGNNPHFEMHCLSGEKHHMHLNSPNKVAAYVIPFLEKYKNSQSEQQSKM